MQPILSHRDLLNLGRFFGYDVDRLASRGFCYGFYTQFTSALKVGDLKSWARRLQFLKLIIEGITISDSMGRPGLSVNLFDEWYQAVQALDEGLVSPVNEALSMFSLVQQKNIINQLILPYFERVFIQQDLTAMPELGFHRLWWDNLDDLGQKVERPDYASALTQKKNMEVELGPINITQTPYLNWACVLALKNIEELERLLKLWTRQMKESNKRAFSILDYVIIDFEFNSHQTGLLYYPQDDKWVQIDANHICLNNEVMETIFQRKSTLEPRTLFPLLDLDHVIKNLIASHLQGDKDLSFAIALNVETQAKHKEYFQQVIRAWVSEVKEETSLMSLASDRLELINKHFSFYRYYMFSLDKNKTLNYINQLIETNSLSLPQQAQLVTHLIEFYYNDEAKKLIEAYPQILFYIFSKADYDKGANNILFLAAEVRNIEMVEFILAKGVNPSLPIYIGGPSILDFFEKNLSDDSTCLQLLQVADLTFSNQIKELISIISDLSEIPDLPLTPEEAELINGPSQKEQLKQYQKQHRSFFFQMSKNNEPVNNLQVSSIKP